MSSIDASTSHNNLLTPEEAAQLMSQRAGYKILPEDVKQLRRYGRIKAAVQKSRTTLYERSEIEQAPLPKKRNRELITAEYEHDNEQSVIREATAQEFLMTHFLAAQTIPSLEWNMPYPRNPFFTGRNVDLEFISSILTSSFAPYHALALSGIGGIGKTQTAIEYAYRYQHAYGAVFFLNASDNQPDRLISQLAEKLMLTESEAKDQHNVLTTITHKLQSYQATTHKSILIIIDGLDKIQHTTTQHLLSSLSDCHVLLTTRAQITGTLAYNFTLTALTNSEGIQLLLCRSKLIPLSYEKIPAEDWLIANEIVELLGGHPLAIDQAGAYIEQTACGLSGYLERYQHNRNILLKTRGISPLEVQDTSILDHPSPVTDTLSISLQTLDQTAIDFLHLCAFLGPDRIPEEIFVLSSSELGPELQKLASNIVALDTVVASLRNFSLIQRNIPYKELEIHPLVQAVIRDQMDPKLQIVWAERAIKATHRLFSFSSDRKNSTLETISQSFTAVGKYFAAAEHCTTLINEYTITLPAARELLDRLNAYKNFLQESTTQHFTLNDNDDQIMYSDGWVYELNTNRKTWEYNFANDIHFTEQVGAFFELQFTGTGIVIIANTRFSAGEIEITISPAPSNIQNSTNQLQTTINTAAFAGVSRAMIFQKELLESGDYILRGVLKKGSFALDALRINC